jgi:hypothetical protein
VRPLAADRRDPPVLLSLSLSLSLSLLLAAVHQKVERL